MASARAAYVAGFAATLQPRGARSGTAYRRPAPARTASRCCTTPRRTRSGRRCDVARQGTTLLVDTYDVAEAVRAGGRGRRPGARRGAARLRRPAASSPTQVRAQLDELGATETRIVVTSDLDEYAIAALGAAPVDGYGVGTELVTGSGHPTCGFVYKLVAREGDDGRDGVGGEEEQGQDLDRRPEVRPAPPYAARRRRGRGDRHRRRRPRTTATTGPCWSRWCATARSSAASPSTAARERATSPRATSCPLAAQQMSARASRCSTPSTSDHRCADPGTLAAPAAARYVGA